MHDSATSSPTTATTLFERVTLPSLLSKLTVAASAAAVEAGASASASASSMIKSDSVSELSECQ